VVKAISENQVGVPAGQDALKVELDPAQIFVGEADAALGAAGVGKINTSIVSRQIALTAYNILFVKVAPVVFVPNVTTPAELTVVPVVVLKTDHVPPVLLVGDVKVNGIVVPGQAVGLAAVTTTSQHAFATWLFK
jgi:hypothetical protein